jgi:hypothetical protein
MAKELTQAECRKSFADMAKAVMDGIRDIDNATPALMDETEPQWWRDMMDIRRKLQEWRERHGEV